MHMERRVEGMWIVKTIGSHGPGPTPGHMALDPPHAGRKSQVCALELPAKGPVHWACSYRQVHSCSHMKHWCGGKIMSTVCMERKPGPNQKKGELWHKKVV
jgi:hypothetical protein